MQKYFVLESTCVLSAELSAPVHRAHAHTPQICHLLGCPVADSAQRQGPRAQQPVIGGNCAEAQELG